MSWLKFCLVWFVILALHRFGIGAIIVISVNMMFSMFIFTSFWHSVVSDG
jgi:hypothetical protein